MQTFSLTKAGLNRLVLAQYLNFCWRISIDLLTYASVPFVYSLGRGDDFSYVIWLVVPVWLILILVAILGFSVFSYRRLRPMVVELGENFVGYRDGRSETRIARDEIAGAKRTREGIHIKSADRVRWIAIPRQIDGYAVIEATVGRWVTIPSERPISKFLIGITIGLLLVIYPAIYYDAMWVVGATLVVWVVLFIYLERESLRGSLAQPIRWNGNYSLYILFFFLALAATIAFGVGVYTLAMKIV